MDAWDIDWARDGYKPAILNLASRWHACGGYHDGTSAQEESIMLDKICTIYRLALKNGHDSIVLGAFGCGVFHLRPDLVAAMFARVLEEKEFKGKFRALPFAILEGRGTARKSVEEQGKFAAFYQQFGRWV